MFDEDDFSEKDWLKAASGNDAFDFLSDESEDIYGDSRTLKANRDLFRVHRNREICP